MIALACLLPSLYAILWLNVPAGSELRIRMTTPVATWSSPVDMPIRAVLIAPVAVKGQEVLPAGCLLTGRIKAVSRVGFGIRHERASLDLEFTTLTLPNGGTQALTARVTQVDNGRERVNRAGLIEGIRATSSIAYRVSGYIKMALLWHFHAQAVAWAIKSLVVQLPEPEIYYPAGTEMTLGITADLRLPVPSDRAEPAVSVPEFPELEDAAASLPVRTHDPESGRLSDPTNILFVGSESEITAAFRAAGWDSAGPLSLRSRIGYIRAAAETRGYASPPMTPLLLNETEADMCWQKGLNDLSKRHHLRVWRQPSRWQGQELWMAAASHDIDFAYLRPGRAFTHRIDPNLDEEREKVTNDLVFTSCADRVAWVERPAAPRSAYNGTGDAFVTDGRLAVVRFHACSPALPAATDGAAGRAPATRGGRWQRLVRREILVARSDLIRANVYWRVYELARRAFARTRDRGATADPGVTDAAARRPALGLAWSSLQRQVTRLRVAMGT